MSRINVGKEKIFLVLIIVLLLTVGGILFINATTAAAATAKNISSLKITGIQDTPYAWNSATLKLLIKDANTVLKEGIDYTVSYQNNSYLGRATVVIEGKGKYTGTVKENFHIVPPKVTLNSVESTKGGKVTISWKYFIEGNGYQIYYSSSPKGKYKKLTTIDSSSTYTYEASLTENKAYYIKVRAYYYDGYDYMYGAFSNTLKVTVAEKEVKAETKVKIIDSGKKYGSYIMISDLPKTLTEGIKMLYPNGAVTELRVQYLDKNTKEGRWVNFFEPYSEENDLTMGKNEYVGMFSYVVITSDQCSVVDKYFEDLVPDSYGTAFSGSKSRIYNREGGNGAYVVSERENPAVSASGIEQGYVDLKNDGFITIISGACEWLPN